jgi:hypothetical protein
MGMAACSSSAVNGLGPGTPLDAADEPEFDASPFVTGLPANPPDATLPCGGGPCGSLALPPDGGDAGGLVPDADADGSPVDASLNGSDASVDSPDAIAHCGGVCGVIVHVDE